MTIPHRWLSIIALAVTLSACVSDDFPPDEEDTEASETAGGAGDAPEFALYVFGAWHRVYSTSTSYVEIRYCKTSTRVNWEFRHNPYAFVVTGGTAISSITSNIAGVTAGSKYRTHNNSKRMFWNFGVDQGGGPLVVTGWGADLINIPAC